MSSEHSNLMDCNKMFQHSDNSLNCSGNRTVIDSKIRKCYFTLHDKQIERDLRVTISIYSGDVICDQTMLVELTNDANPIFLFQLSITKTDFDTLKNDQGLNVEFKDFPQALVKLLDHCKESSSESGGNFRLMLVDYCGTAAGGRIMDMNKITIKIIEECAFRNICHLTLDILRATELQIRQKLEEELYKLKQSLLIKSKFHDEALIKISDLVEEISTKDNIIEKSNGIINDLMVQKEEECSRLRSQAETQEALIRKKFDEKLTEEQKQFEKQSSQMEAKIENLEKELRIFHDKELEMQNILHEKERSKELLELELISKKQEISQLRTQNEKLDSDYHDKEKTVNILRTRLAVAEQELKDINVLVLNNQNKLDQVICEKNNFQTNVEFLLNKLDQKEITIKNVSDEIMKANEIIAKEQAIINTISSKLKEHESINLKLKESLKTKEEIICEQNNVLSKVQEDLTLSVKESTELREKIVSLEKKISELNTAVKKKSKHISSLKVYYEKRLEECETHNPNQSLLSYRAYLSTPNLLPSDNHRYKGYMLDLFLQDDIDSTDEFSSKFSKFVKPFLFRYLKRFQSVPVSLFRSSDTPLGVLYDPHGSQSSQSKQVRKASPENITQVTEYGVYNNLNSYIPVTQFKKHKPVKSSKHNDNSNKLKYVDETNNLDNNRTEEDEEHQNVVPDSIGSHGDNFGLRENSTVPHYAPVGAFRLRPSDRFQKMTYHPSVYRRDQNSMRTTCQDKTDSNFTKIRKTPAVSAPPLTPEQRNDVSVFKTFRAQNTIDEVQACSSVHSNSHLRPSELCKPIYASKLPSKTSRDIVSRNNQVRPSKAVSEILTTVHTAGSESANKRIPARFGPLAYNTEKQVLVLKPFKTSFDKSKPVSESSSFETSVDLPEPSAYFAT